MTSVTPDKSQSSLGSFFKAVAVMLVAAVFFIISFLVLWLSQTPTGATIANSLSSLFAMNSVQSWWYVTRAAGLTSYFLMWLSMVWGMAVSTKFFHPVVEGTYSYDFHEFLSLLGIGFVILHVVVLMVDKYLAFNIFQILIPFVNTYRPLWVGIGIIGFYLFLLVTVTFYLKKHIGSQAFRSIHMLSLAGYIGATLHGLFAGTDSALPVTKLLYVGTSLVILFLTVYWIVIGLMTKQEKARAAAIAARARRQPQRLSPNRR